MENGAMGTRPPGVNIVNAAVGACFIALGVLLLLEGNGVVQMEQIVRLWPIGLVVLGGAAVWQASRGGDAMPRSGSGAGWLLWLVIIGAVFNYAYDRQADAATNGGDVNAFAVFGSDRPRVSGQFHRGRVTAVLGGVEMDMLGASLAPGETAELDVFTVMGGTGIRVPASWDVSIETTTIAGGVNDQRRGRGEATPAEGESTSGTDAAAGAAEPAPAPPRLVVKGFVMMGGVTIKR